MRARARASASAKARASASTRAKARARATEREKKGLCELNVKDFDDFACWILCTQTLIKAN